MKSLDNSAYYVGIGAAKGAKVKLNNCTFTFLTSHTGLRIAYNSTIELHGGSVTSGDVLSFTEGEAGGRLYLDGVDLSSMDSGTVLSNSGALSTDGRCDIVLNQCKMPATFSLLLLGWCLPAQVIL